VRCEVAGGSFYLVDFPRPRDDRNPVLAVSRNWGMPLAGA
jgi:hypothetical protein